MKVNFENYIHMSEFNAIQNVTGFPGVSDGKESAHSVRDQGSIPGLGRSPEENDNSLQYSCLESPMDRGAWQPTVPGLPKVRHI